MNNPGSDSFFVDDWHVSPAEGVLSRGNEKVRLEPKAMDVMVYFASRPGEVITRADLERDVWKGAVVGYDAVTNTVIKLRKAFGDDARHPRIIETLPKRGYRLIAEVRRPVAPASMMTAPGRGGRKVGFGFWRVRRWWATGILAALGVVAVSLIILETRQPATPDTIKADERVRLVVLPFQDLSKADGQDYFSIGLTEDLITALSGIPDLAVIANDSAFVYQGNAPLERLREELRIQYVLRGSVRKDAGRVRINVRLIDATQGHHLWAERYEEQLADAFAVQDAIVERIATSLEVSMRGTREGGLRMRDAAGIEAYDQFLRGRERYSRRTRADLNAAASHFHKAIKLDPRFARAYASLALVHLRDVMDAWIANPSVALQSAKARATEATELNAALPEAHFVNAVVALFERQYDRSVAELDKAIALRPSYADAYATLAWVLHFAGRPQAARPHLATAMQLNPHVAASYLLIDGGIAFTLGETEAAISSLERAREMSPTHPRILLWLAAAYARAGHIVQANWVIEELQVLHPAITLSRLEDAFPFRDRDVMQILKLSLQKAGLPK